MASGASAPSRTTATGRLHDSHGGVPGGLPGRVGRPGDRPRRRACRRPLAGPGGGRGERPAHRRSRRGRGWYRLSPGVIHQARAFHDVDEVVTDAEGRFVLPERELSPPNPFVTIDGPQPHHVQGRLRPLAVPGAPPMTGPGGMSAVLRHSEEAMAEFGRTGAISSSRR